VVRCNIRRAAKHPEFSCQRPNESGISALGLFLSIYKLNNDTLVGGEVFRKSRKRVVEVDSAVRLYL
jgi:hypothetical protein